MIGPREVFAMAERHAWWCRVTFNADVAEMRQELEHWRNRNDLALSNHAIAILSSHVAAVPVEPAAPAGRAA